MLCHRLRRWPNIRPTVGCRVFSGWAALIANGVTCIAFQRLCDNDRCVLPWNYRDQPSWQSSPVIIIRSFRAIGALFLQELSAKWNLKIRDIFIQVDVKYAWGIVSIRDFRRGQQLYYLKLWASVSFHWRGGGDLFWRQNLTSIV